MEKFLQYIAKEWPVIRQAPITFLAAILVVVGMVWTAMQWRYGGIIDNQSSRITTLTEENLRIRVALGIEPATPSALLTLSNKELQAKASSVVAKLREIDSVYEDDMANISRRSDLSQDEKSRLYMTAPFLKVLDQRYLKEAKSDTANIDFELRRRLGPTAVAGIVGVLPSFTFGTTQFNAVTLMGSGGDNPTSDLGYLSPLANGIEQMAKLLPDKG